MTDQASRAAREGALVVVERSWVTLRAVGPEAAEWLQGLLSCDVTSLSDGAGARGLLLTKQGKIVADLAVVPVSDGVLLGVAAERAEPAHELLGHHLIMEDAELELERTGTTWARLHGPRAAAVAEQLAAARSGAWARVDWTGLGGAVVALPGTAEVALAELPEAAVLATDDDWTRLRIERGVPEWGDFGENDRPHEAALDRRAVSWSKGCYLGQEVVCMQDMRGKVKRRLALLALDELVPSGAEVCAADAVVGTIASSALTEAGPRALAQLRAPHEAPGSELVVAGKAARVIEP